VGGLLLLIGFLGSLPVFAATTRVDPACAGQECNGSDPYATLCAGQPFDHEYAVRSAPVVFAGQSLGTVQLWYSPLCHTSWARTVADSPHILLNATLTLPLAARRYTRAAWNSNAVSSPQAFVPVPLTQGSGEMLHAGYLVYGCVSMIVRGPGAC
jgi:hypothetical protein